MTDTELEDRLTTMFEGRAATITTIRPIRFSPSGKGRTRLSPAPFAMAAVVAAVLVTVGGTVVGIRAAHHDTRPLGPTSSTNAATSTPTPTASACAGITVPIWVQAIAAGQISLDHAINNVISVNASTGDYLVDEVRPAAAGKSGQATLALFHGKAEQDIAQLPGNGSTQVLADGSAAVNPDWIAYGLYQPGGQNGYATAVLYNRHTAQSIVLANKTSASQLNSAPILFGGKAYWLEAGYGGQQPSLVKSYDLANGARTSTPVPTAVDLVYYGSGLAVVTQDGQGNTALANFTGTPLAPAVIRAASQPTYFSYDGATLRWWNYTSQPGLPVLYANRPGSAEVDRVSVEGQNMTGLNTWPFVEVAASDPSSPIVDLRTNTLLAMPEGLNVQAVIGDQVLIGTGLTRLGNGGLSLVSLRDLPPAQC